MFWSTSIRRQEITWHMCLCFSFLRLLQHSGGKESDCNGGDLGSIPAGEDPLEKGMASHSNILGEFLGQRSLVGYSSWGHKELDTTEQLTPYYMLI